MRLANVESGHRLPQRIMLGMMRLMSGQRPPDVVRVLLYRPELFGKPFSRLAQAALRGDSEWTVGERELFAAFTSRLNQCVF